MLDHDKCRAPEDFGRSLENPTLPTLLCVVPLKYSPVARIWPEADWRRAENIVRAQMQRQLSRPRVESKSPESRLLVENEASLDLSGSYLSTSSAFRAAAVSFIHSC